MYNVSMARIKTIKHVQLALYIKRKTGSKDIVTLLNRMGHCISYAQVNMQETYLATIHSNNQNVRNFVPDQHFIHISSTISIRCNKKNIQALLNNNGIVCQV